MKLLPLSLGTMDVSNGINPVNLSLKKRKKETAFTVRDQGSCRALNGRKHQIWKDTSDRPAWVACSPGDIERHLCSLLSETEDPPRQMWGAIPGREQQGGRAGTNPHVVPTEKEQGVGITNQSQGQ